MEFEGGLGSPLTDLAFCFRPGRFAVAENHDRFKDHLNELRRTNECPDLHQILFVQRF